MQILQINDTKYINIICYYLREYTVPALEDKKELRNVLLLSYFKVEICFFRALSWKSLQTFVVTEKAPFF